MLKDVLQRFLELEETGEQEYLTTCPFHEDNRPSLSVNLEKSVYFCHACQAKGGVFDLLAKLTRSNLRLVKLELDLLDGYIAPRFIPDVFMKRLLDNDKQMRYLYEKRKWSPRIIEELRIGYDGNRITIPIFDIYGFLVNVRAYKPGAAKEEPKVINLKGYGKARLYMSQYIGTGDEPIYIVEGEPDCIAGRSAGLACVTSTAGAGHFNAAWAPVFKGRKVRVLYDVDEAGVRGAERAAGLLARYAADTRIISLGPVLRGGKDLTDYLVQGGTIESLEKMAAEVQPVVAKGGNGEQDDTIYEVALSESSEEKYYHKRVKMKVMISGKMLSPYMVPRKVHVHCSLPNMKMCTGCTLNLDGGSKSLIFNVKTDDTLQLVETATENHIKVIKKIAGVPNRCSIVDYDVKEAQNIEEAKVSPDLDFSTDDSQYVLRQIYYLGHGLEANTVYEIIGRAIPHPKTQQVTYLIDEVTSLDDTVSAFKVTDGVVSRLRIFSIEQNRKETQ